MSEIREQTLHGMKGMPNYPINTDKKVLFAIEDTGNAYNLYKDYLIRNFSISNADIVGVGGADNFKKEIEKRLDYDAYIIIYDAGVESGKIKKISNAISFIKSNNAVAKIFTFTPMCFEEVLLSFSDIQDYINKNNKKNYEMFTKLQLLMEGNISKIDYFNYDDYMQSTEQKIERILEELTAGTVLRYEHYNRDKKRSLMSDCWLYDCCLVDITKEKNLHLNKLRNNCKPIKLHNYRNKLDLMAHNSLLGGLTNIIVEVFGIKGVSKKLAKMSGYDRLVGRIA